MQKNQRQQYRLAVIIPYFGTFPEWMDLFILSCRKNHTTSDGIAIDWYIFTDNAEKKISYDNVRLIPMTFSDYCRNVSEVLKIDFKPVTPYKLCDLKPYYGVIHNDLLNEYTHWAFGDLDLCYGDLSILVNNRLLGRYDLITTHADRVAGHFTIVNKSSRFNCACLGFSGWKSRLADNSKVYGLDEYELTYYACPLMKQWLRLYRIARRVFKYRKGIYDFMKVPNIFHNLISRSHIREYYTSPLPKDGEIWEYDMEQNRITDPQGRELPYLHFLFFKKTPFWDNDRYWRPGFWKVSDLRPETCRKILFNNSFVEAEIKC